VLQTVDELDPHSDKGALLSEIAGDGQALFEEENLTELLVVVGTPRGITGVTPPDMIDLEGITGVDAPLRRRGERHDAATGTWPA
jgi:hypothetical protein